MRVRTGSVTMVAALAVTLLSARPATAGLQDPPAPPVDGAVVSAAYPSALEELHAAATALAEAEARLNGARRRAVDTRADLADVEPLVQDTDGRAAEAAEAVDVAARSVVAAEAELARTEGSRDLARDLTVGHAATIFKRRSSPELRAMQSLLRSGSPSRFVVHMKMEEAVLEVDAERLEALETEVTDRRTTVEARRDALDAARLVAADRAAEARRVGDLRTELERAVGSSRGEVAAAGGALAQARQRAAAAAAAVARLEQQAAADPTLVAGLAAARADAEADWVTDLDEALPFRTSGGSPRARSVTTVGYACPVPGGTFVDDWRFPRPGGRTHEGTDVFAERGAPVQAVAAGTVAEIDPVDTHVAGEVRGDLGGITVTIEHGAERWYYAHLDRVDPALAVGVAVTAGAPIGTVGDTGNARGGAPHLHLGRSLGDAVANPFPALFLACGPSDPSWPGQHLQGPTAR